jgi:hypothetical protein
VIFSEFSVLLPVKKELGHLSWFFAPVRPENAPMSYRKTGWQSLRFRAMNLGFHAKGQRSS